MDLFLANGYEQATVAQIAERAGVTARTFFRYFADKREVLFAGSEHLQEAMVEALMAAPTGSPMDAIAAALDAAAQALPAERSYPAQRNAVIMSNPGLLERELIKMAVLTGALAEGLRQRGVAEPEASLAAEAGIAVFRVGFATWVSSDNELGLADVFRTVQARLTALNAAQPAAS
jgi:AcrR family transcriptional regulator